VRTFLIKMRDPMVLATQLGTAIFMGLIFGGLYFNVYDKEEEAFAVLDAQMCITMAVVMTMFLPFDVTLTFPKERKVFLRERKAGLYPTTAFYTSRILADMPMHVLAAVVMSLIIYSMAGLRMELMLFIAVNVYSVLVGAAMMQCIGAVCRTFEEANLLMMPVMFLTMMTSSSFVRQVPGWLTWMRDISVMGLLADTAMYWEFRNYSTDEYSGDQVLASAAVRIRSDAEVMEAMLSVLVVLLAARLTTLIAVKFLHTGRSSCAENLRD
jgi:ABC-type multidrug transport system permease subunit